MFEDMSVLERRDIFLGGKFFRYSLENMVHYRGRVVFLSLQLMILIFDSLFSIIKHQK